jgi:hypothetical protein
MLPPAPVVDVSLVGTLDLTDGMLDGDGCAGDSTAGAMETGDAAEGDPAATGPGTSNVAPVVDGRCGRSVCGYSGPC